VHAVEERRNPLSHFGDASSYLHPAGASVRHDSSGAGVKLEHIVVATDASETGRGAGGAFDAIQAAAHEQGTGMVALATHGRGGLRCLVLGSVADRLVRAAELPVLVTRPRGR
jgi:nucleotide-binding universal stress UspA family protein